MGLATPVPGNSATVTVVPAPAPAPGPTVKARDIDPVVRGQVRMHAIIGALQSPAGHVFAVTAAEYDAWVRRAADLVCAYTFEV